MWKCHPVGHLCKDHTLGVIITVWLKVSLANLYLKPNWFGLFLPQNWTVNYIHLLILKVIFDIYYAGFPEKKTYRLSISLKTQDILPPACIFILSCFLPCSGSFYGLQSYGSCVQLPANNMSIKKQSGHIVFD